MPEEKVTKRNNPDVSEWGSSGYIPVLPKPAADSGPRQLDGKFSYDSKGIFNTVSGERIPDDEPIFMLRARDHHAIAAIHAYIEICAEDCNDLHLAALSQTEHKFSKFAVEHADRMKEPGKTRHVKLEATAPPVPQEAAPRCPFGYTKEQPGTKHECAIHSLSDYEATAPDSAMRVARQAWEKLIRIYCKAEYRPLLDDAHVAEIAALIREAGSDEITKLRADYDLEHKWLNDAASEANSDLDSVASVIRKLREAGSERERESFESCAKELREHYNSDWDSTVPGAEFDAEILRILRKHLG